MFIGAYLYEHRAVKETVLASVKRTSKAPKKSSRAAAKTNTAAGTKKEAATGAPKRALPEKKRLSPAELRAASSEIAEAFPRSVDDDDARLVLLDVDPKRIHAYWNIPLQHYTKSIKKTGAGEKTLRVYRLPHESTPVNRPEHFFDIDVQGLRNQQYIDLQQDRASYAAEMGITASGGMFIPLVRSNVITTPPAGISPDRSSALFDTRGVALKEGLQPEISTGFAAAPPEPAAGQPGGAAPQVRYGQDLPPSAPVSRKARPLPAPGEIFDEQEIDRLIQKRLKADTAALLRPEDGADTSSPGCPEPVPAESVSSHSLVRADGAPFPWRAELVIEGRVRPGVQLVLYGDAVAVALDGSFKITRRLPDDLRLLTALSLVHHGNAPEVQQGPALSLSADGEEVDSLQLEIYASLHLSGTVATQQILSLFKNEITVKPDGSFYLTRVLPRGAFILPELMVSASAKKG